MGMDGSSGSPSSGVEIPSLGVEQVVEEDRQRSGDIPVPDLPTQTLYFGASLAPRMEQAASQIHDSRDLVFSGGVAIQFNSKRLGKCIDTRPETLTSKACGARAAAGTTEGR